MAEALRKGQAHVAERQPLLIVFSGSRVARRLKRFSF